MGLKLTRQKHLVEAQREQVRLLARPTKRADQPGSINTRLTGRLSHGIQVVNTARDLTGSGGRETSVENKDYQCPSGTLYGSVCLAARARDCKSPTQETAMVRVHLGPPIGSRYVKGIQCLRPARTEKDRFGHSEMKHPTLEVRSSDEKLHRNNKTQSLTKVINYDYDGMPYW